MPGLRLLRRHRLRGRLGARRFPLAVIELGFRLAVGATFFRSGLNKLQSFDTAISLFREEYRLPLLPPELAATLGTTVELAAPVLLVLGLGARLGAAALLAMTLTIQLLVYPENWPEHLMWGSILAYVLRNGPGTLSFDHLIARRLFDSANAINRITAMPAMPIRMRCMSCLVPPLVFPARYGGKNARGTSLHVRSLWMDRGSTSASVIWRSCSRYHLTQVGRRLVAPRWSVKRWFMTSGN